MIKNKEENFDNIFFLKNKFLPFKFLFKNIYFYIFIFQSWCIKWIEGRMTKNKGESFNKEYFLLKK